MLILGFNFLKGKNLFEKKAGMFITFNKIEGLNVADPVKINGLRVGAVEGLIEQDADMVMFLYRPDYYDITTNDMGEDTKGDTYVKIAKHRNGSLENIKLKAKLFIQKFEEHESLDPFGRPADGGGGSWRPVNEEGGAKLYIQKGSRMNDNQDDMEDTPF
jgi:hypothetical protein